MACITWLGEDTEEQPGPSYNVWNGIKFPKGVAVEVTDEAMLRKARMNRFYSVTESGEDTPREKSHEEQEAPKGEAKRQGQARGLALEETKPSGYVPVKKKVKKPKAKEADSDPGGGGVSTPDT